MLGLYAAALPLWVVPEGEAVLLAAPELLGVFECDVLPLEPEPHAARSRRRLNATAESFMRFTASSKRDEPEADTRALNVR
jgi:hypothetical protein